MSKHFRIIDANTNRAREGLRVIEEYSRFILDSKPLTEKIKKIRHTFSSSIDNLQEKYGISLLKFRDTAGDIGTKISTAEEGLREDAGVVAKAASKRLQEALRSIEEYTKISSSEASAAFEQLRYKVYDIEKELFSDIDRKTRLSNACLYVLITESLATADSETTAKEIIAGGGDIIQMREKDLEDKEFYNRAETLNNLCRAGNTLFLLNDRPHIAELLETDGIHTGQGDLPVNLCRRIIGTEKIIGKSTSSPEFLKQAQDDGADYIGVGPVYETNTKKHRAAVGLEYVKYASENAQIPYFCIGSINRETIDGVLDAGAGAVAVCTAIIGAKNIAAETAWFKERILERSKG
ncbi:MAG: thiamine phosphate synthase [Planctomycetota bacterium]|jgi:thiamine-phosphate pyrophosphorylase